MSSIKLKHSGGNAVSLHPPTSAPSSSDVQFKLPTADGSSGQYMKTDGSGNLSFATVTDTNDFVKLQAATGTSAVSALLFQNLDVTTYRTFKFVFSLQSVTDDVQLRLRLLDGSTFKTNAGTYNWGIVGILNNGSVHDSAGADSYANLVSNFGNNNYEGARGELTYVPHVSGDPAYMNNFGYCISNRYNISNAHRGDVGFFKFYQADVTDG